MTTDRKCKLCGLIIERDYPHGGDDSCHRLEREHEWEPYPSERMVSIDRTVLQHVFDAAVNSMDFGSGFLCDDDVEALRVVAMVLGVDPMVATPINFKCKYLNNGAHTWGAWGAWVVRDPCFTPQGLLKWRHRGRNCTVCGKGDYEEIKELTPP